MQALFDLIHSLAKEEKRLYNLHGRKGRFVHIYEGYIQEETYNKNLDRQIYAKHFSKFSKAFYSMQKNALTDDILAVLLEYSNSSKPEYNLSKVRSKYEVLMHKGFYDFAITFIKSALENAKKLKDEEQYVRVLKDYAGAIILSDSAIWEDYEAVSHEIIQVKETIDQDRHKTETQQKLEILLRSSQLNPGEMVKYKDLAHDVLEDLREIAEGDPTYELQRELFESEYDYSRTFEDKFALHKRLVEYEKLAGLDNYPQDLKIRILNLLLENSLDCGDFLLINSLIYKTKRQLENIDAQKDDVATACFWELAGIYHYYENDLPESQNELQRVLQNEALPDEVLIRNYYNIAAVLIAANLPKNADQYLNELQKKYPEQKHKIDFKMLKLVILVESNQKEEAITYITRMKTYLRKQPNPRKLSYLRNFLDLVAKHLERKKVRWQEIAQFNTDWRTLFKPNLWLKAKTENYFYFNYILKYWQEQKQVLNV